MTLEILFYISLVELTSILLKEVFEYMRNTFQSEIRIEDRYE